MNSKTRSPDDEIDLIPLLQALWAGKLILITAAVAGAAVAFAFYATTAEQWTASTYLTKSSRYNWYKEVKQDDPPTNPNQPPIENRLYGAIQNDAFFTALGVMTAKSIDVRESAPKLGGGESALYVASTTAPTGEQAQNRLKAALESANTDAIALSLPTLAGENSVRAFNTLSDIKVAKIENSKKSILLGGFLGLVLGGLFVIGRFLILQYKQSNRARDEL